MTNALNPLFLTGGPPLEVPWAAIDRGPRAREALAYPVSQRWPTGLLCLYRGLSHVKV
jgi:hypothetical protein